MDIRIASRGLGMAGRRLFALAAAFAALLAGNAHAIRDGVAVTALPAPDATGAYVFGNAGYAPANFFDSDLTAGLAYPVWDEIAVPAGSTVKFVGGVALSSLPVGCTCDFSGATHLLVTDSSVFGSGFTVPESATLLFLRCNVTVDGAAASFSTPSTTGAIDVPFVLNGTNTLGRDRGNVVFNGPVTGADTGCFELGGFSRNVTFAGSLSFNGKVHLRNSQRNQRAIVTAPEAESRIGMLEGSDWGNDKTNQAHGAPQQLLYLPASPSPCTLVVGSFNQNEIGGLLEPEETGFFKYRRWGVILATCSNNTICVSNVVRHGAVHLMACSNGAYTFGNEPAFDEGFGNFEIVHLGKNPQGHADRAPTFYPSPNANLRFTGRFTGNYNSTTPSFDYTAESNVVNRGTLDTTAATVYEWGTQRPTVTGYSPWNLPRAIATHDNLKRRMTVIATDDRWLMPFDFGASADEIDVARCETDAMISVPAAGTVVVSNATTAAGARPVAGRYPVITGNSVTNSVGASGAAAFANWTIEQAGRRWGAARVSLDARDTGLWIDIDIPSGSMFQLR